MTLGKSAYLLAVMGLAIPLLAACQSGSNMDSEMCRQKLQPFFSEQGPLDPLQRLASIKGLESECSGSGAFELALSTAHLMASQYTDAERVAEYGLTLQEGDREGLSYVLFGAMAGKRDWAGAGQVADSVTDKYPQKSVGYLLKGRYLNGIGDFNKAIIALEKANTIEPRSETFQHLTIAYYNANRFLDSVNAFEASMRLNNRALYEINVVLAASASYYEVGSMKESGALLQEHIKLVPESRANPMVVKMLTILGGAE